MYTLDLIQLFIFNFFSVHRISQNWNVKRVHAAFPAIPDAIISFHQSIN